MKTVDLREVLEKYEGSWVALKPYTNKVVASGKEPKEVTSKARKKGVKNPVILKAQPVKHLFVG